MKQTLSLSSKNQAFTLIEIMVVIVIIGIIATFAIPKYQTQVKKIKNREAENILRAVYGAQKDYSIDNAGNYATTIANLDISIPSADIKNFKNLTVANADTVTCTGELDYVASIQANDESYRLYILEDQTSGDGIVCMNCDTALCLRMGYKAF